MFSYRSLVFNRIYYRLSCMARFGAICRFIFIRKHDVVSAMTGKENPLEGFPLSLFCSFSYAYMNGGKPSGSFQKNIRFPGCFGVAGNLERSIFPRASIITLMNTQFISSPLNSFKPKGRCMIFLTGYFGT